MRETSFKHLKHFFGAYFHQDWDLEYPDYISIVKDFIKNESCNSIKGVICNFEMLLSKKLSEDELADIAFNELGSCFTPTPSGVTHRQWFADLKRMFSESLEGIEPNPVYPFMN